MMKDILENGQYLSDIARLLDDLPLSRLQGKSLLITGGLGLIGSAVVDLLTVYNEKRDGEVRLLVADINEAFYKERYAAHPSVTYLPYDATKPIAFHEKAELIIHGAGLASPELYVSHPVETMLSNLEGVRNLLEYAKENGTARLLYVSSSEVYGQKETCDPFKEDRFGAVNIGNLRASYAEAKRASELLCHAYTAEYGVDTVTVRPGHIYGPTASPRDLRISSAFSYAAARGETLVMKSAGLQKRSYCYSLDCAAAILTVLLDGESGEAYNIGHGEVTSIREMAEMLAVAGGVPLHAAEPSAEEKAQFNPMDNSSLCSEKISAIGHRDRFTVREGLTHTVRILRDLYC